MHCSVKGTAWPGALHNVRPPSSPGGGRRHAGFMTDDAAAPLPRPHRGTLWWALVLLLIALAIPPPAAAAAGWGWPLTPKPALVRPFRAPAQKWLAGHRGVDLAAAPGTVVKAPEAGTVSFAGVVVDRPVLTIDHGNGLKSSFEPVIASVARGETVEKGRAVGTIAGAGHCPDGRCMHWGVRRDGEYVNPLQFVQDLRPSVLLPVPRE